MNLQWYQTEEELRASENGSELLKEDPKAPGGFRAPREGEVFRNALLASTLRLLAENGKAGFYEGPVAEAIIQTTEKRGGFHTAEDLIDHARRGSEIGEAISLKLGELVSSEQGNTGRVNGLELWEHAPNGQGIVALISLGLLQRLVESGKLPKLTHLKHNSAKYLITPDRFPIITKANSCLDTYTL
jgi:gamma-glutamyltranspeptidase/glutathione hydrolase